MKHLKLFESNNIEKDIENTLEHYDELCELLTKYLKHKKLGLDIRSVYRFYYERDLSELGDIGLVISFTDKKYNDGEGFIIFEKELPELYRFMEHPERYIEEEKFNL